MNNENIIYSSHLIKNHLDLITCKKILYTHGFSHLKWTVGSVLKNNLVRRTLRAIPTELRYVKHGYNYYKNLAPILAKFDYVTYLSDTDDSYKWAQEHGLNNSVVITNACDDWFFENAKKTYEIDSDEHPLTFIYVANYEKRKNQELLVEAFSITLCEAAALGIPIISTDVGNAKSFDGIILANKAGEIAEAMKSVCDKKIREFHGKKLNFYANKNFKIDSRVNILETLLLYLLSNYSKIVVT